MSTIHEIHAIHFPRFHEDVMSERRTLFHMPVVDAQTWARVTRFASSPGRTFRAAKSVS